MSSMTSRADTTRPRELGAVLDFLRLLWAIEHLLKSTSKRMQRHLGMTGPQRLVLRIVEQFPGISAGELSEILHLHPSTLTGVIARLASRRLLVRERDFHDGRRVLLRPVHRAAASPSGPTVEAAVQKAFDQVTHRQIEHASAVLHALVGTLEAHADRTNARPAPAGRARQKRPAARPRRRRG